ncbi:hypothetical protein [Phyllobacterium sp. SB3]|uniref:hypothetical protein n=1 Tax=Phyllobacterium sp. SB3 TaxID=3156073 RepID=UPI0032AEBF7A
MFRIASWVLLAGIISACSSLTQTLPKCDGYSRRPLNRSMWQWEATGQLKQQTSKAIPADPASRAASYAAEPAFVTPAAIARFEVAASYLPCENE